MNGYIVEPERQLREYSNEGRELRIARGLAGNWPIIFRDA